MRETDWRDQESDRTNGAGFFKGARVVMRVHKTPSDANMILWEVAGDDVSCFGQQLLKGGLAGHQIHNCHYCNCCLLMSVVLFSFVL